jgi:hypothetical protein
LRFILPEAFILRASCVTQQLLHAHEMGVEPKFGGGSHGNVSSTAS